jgi:hypothetical protein
MLFHNDSAQIKGDDRPQDSDKEKKIDVEELQWYRNTWKTETFSPEFPNPLCNSQNTCDTQSISHP